MNGFFPLTSLLPLWYRQGMQGTEDPDVLGRDPNLIKCTDNYQDAVDCRNTKNILEMFRRMEMGDLEEVEDGEFEF